MECRVDVLEYCMANRQRSVLFVESMHIGQNVPAIKSDQARLEEVFLRIGAPGFELERAVPEQSTFGIGLEKFTEKRTFGDQCAGKFFANFRILGLAAKVSLKEPNSEKRCEQNPNQGQRGLESVGQRSQRSKNHASGEKVDRANLMCRDDWRESAAGLA